MMTKSVLLIASAVLLSGCATITQGNKQSILFDSQPSGATCSISRSGDGFLYKDFKTPATLEVEKDKDDITIRCEKDGYKDETMIMSSEFESMTLGNVLIGGVVGVGVDAASGALNEYPAQIVVQLEKE